METIRKITLHAQEVKKDKQSFISCSAEINGRWFKIKFTKDCENAPKTRGLYELTIDFDNCSYEKGKPYVNKNGKKGVANPIIWVREITSIRKYTEEELKKANRASMSALFDGTDEQLPF